MTGDSVNASIFYDGINTVPVVQESVPAVFEIRQLDEWLSVRMGQNSIPVELIPGTPFYYLDGKIYKVPDIQKKYLSIIREGFRWQKRMKSLCRLNTKAALFPKLCR